jgi:hypothetical protein
MSAATVGTQFHFGGNWRKASRVPRPSPSNASVSISLFSKMQSERREEEEGRTMKDDDYVESRKFRSARES